MFHKKAVFCSAAAILAMAVACSESPQSPAAPSGSSPASGEAAADGSTLKVTAPSAQSPVNGAQPQSLTFVAGASGAQFPGGSTLPPLSYQVEVKNAGGTTVCTGTGSASGSTVTISPSCSLAFDTNHTWRMRAVLGSAVGPWSTAATFKSPIGGFFRGNEVYDPLYTGTTVGQAVGAEFVPNVGLRLNSHTSRVTYALPTNLQQGEFSVMVTGVDEGNPGDKTKIFSMQEGTGDITDDDYRMTVEKRGRQYEVPGAVTWRIIMGDAHEHNGRIFDGARIGVSFSDELWYFWKFTWGSGRAALEVREGGPGGRVIYDTSRGTGGFAYRPVPHFVYLGSPVGRGGAQDASIPGAIYKNVWLSSSPRPNLPGE